MSGSNSSGTTGLANQAFFAVLLPDIQTQLANQFQLANLSTLQSFEQQFNASTKYLQLSTAQIALSTGGSAYTLLIQGSGMSIPGASLFGVLNPGSISLSSVNGTVTAAELYAGGSFSNGSVTGGSVVASATFSATQMTLTSGTAELVIGGSNLPTTPAAVGTIANGTYSGPAIGVSSIQVLESGSPVLTVTLGASSLTFVTDGYKLVLNGTFPTALGSTLIDQLVNSTAGSPLSALSITLASAQLTNVATGQVLLNIPYLNNQEFSGSAAQNPLQLLASIATAAAAGDQVSITAGTSVTPLDATLNGSTIDIAGSGANGTATLDFSGDSAITPLTPSVDGQSTISNLVPSQSGAGVTVLNTAGNFVNQGSILANGPAGSSFTIDVTQNTTNGVTTPGAFTNGGTIRSDAGNALTIAIAAGSTVYNAGTLIANGGSLYIDALTPSGVYAQQSGEAIIRNGGLIETNASGTTSLSATSGSFLFADGVAGDTLQIAHPAQFGGRILGFRAGDTIDLGASLAVTQVIYSAATGQLNLENAGGTILAGLALESWSLTTGTFAVTGSVADNLTIKTGSNGDTQVTTSLSNIVTVTAGTLAGALDQTLNASTIDVAGTGSAVVSFTGDTGITVANPSVDATSVISSLVPGQTLAGTTVLNVGGQFINEGTILANGPAGSTFTLNVAQNGTAPSYFINDGSIVIGAGNKMTINIAGTAALFNAGSIIANGGSVLVNAETGSLDGGYAGTSGAVVIEGGGTVESNISIASSLSYFGPTYLFADGTSGNTLKIDNLKQFDANGYIRGFGTGDTIDLGAALSIGTIVYGSTLGSDGLLLMENAGGTILGSLLLSGVHGYGTFAVSGGTADGFAFTTGANGDTLLTTTTTPDNWTGGSGTWLTGANWSLGSAPGTQHGATIGLNSTASFTLTTGTAPLTTTGFTIADPNALVQITSTTSLAFANTASTTAISGVTEFGGTLEVTSGNTLTAESFGQYATTGQLRLDPGSVLDVLGSLNNNAPSNGVITISSGNTVGLRIAGTVLVNDAVLNAGPTQPVAGEDGGSVYLGYGYPGAPAEMTVENGGAVSDTFAVLASDPTSFGELTLNGPGTTWTDDVDTKDPSNSRGYMIVGNNGFVGNTPSGVAQPPFAGTALLTVENGATLTDERAYIGNTIDSAGSVTVSTGGTWDIGLANGGGLSVSSGGQASLSVIAGGTVDIGQPGTFVNSPTSTATIGGIGVGNNTSTATGTITVSGSGSVLNVQAGIVLGGKGQGILNVLNNGTVAAWGGTVTEGLNAGATGTILVSGAGSTLYAGGGVIAGSSGTGTIAVQNGATAQTYGYLELGGSNVGQIGTATGTVSVGSGSFLQAATLDIWAGSTLSVDASSAVDIGYNGVHAAGAVDVESFATLAGDGLIAGGLVNNGSVLAGNSDVASASTGGKLEISGSVSGTGSMTIGAGATLQLDGSVAAGQTIVFSSGTPETLVLGAPAGTIAAAISGFANGDKIEFSNGITVNSASVLSGNTLAVTWHNAGGTIGVYDLTNVSFAANTAAAYAHGTDAATNDAFVSPTAPVVTVLANFTSAIGLAPYGSLIADANGDLFGTANQGGASGTYGSVFELVKSGGTYASSPTALVSFTSSNGANPYSSLTMDAAGDLFGTTNSGGQSSDGTVFEIVKTGSTYASSPTTLASFTYTNGALPRGNLTTDSNGDLFGTTYTGGSFGDGTVFEMIKTGTTYAAPTTLVNFTVSTSPSPWGGLTMDANGDLFGTSTSGGTFGYGTVFEIVKTGSVYATAPTILINFNSTNGSQPRGNLVADSSGDLFGTTYGGGLSGSGTVFEIVRTGTSYATTPTTLVSFGPSTGTSPWDTLIIDSSGNLFGTTSTGGTNNLGTVFELAKTGGGYAGTPIVLSNATGALYGGLLADASGNLFGTTVRG